MSCGATPKNVNKFVMNNLTYVKILFTLKNQFILKKTFLKIKIKINDV